MVGAVAGLRQHLRWFDERPLFGKRIVVTRSMEQAGELIEMLEERGAEAIPAPTIRIAPPEDADALGRACDEASTFDWIVFTSGNGVEYFMERLLATSDVRELKGVRICTIGPSTASRLARYGIRVDLTPAEFRAEAVVDALKATGDARRASASCCRAPTSPAICSPTSCARPAPTSSTSRPIARRRRAPIATADRTSIACCSIGRSTR